MQEIERQGRKKKKQDNIGAGIRRPSFLFLLLRRQNRLSWFPEQATRITLPMLIVPLSAWQSLLSLTQAEM